MWHKLADGRWLELVVREEDPARSHALMTDKRGGAVGRVVEGEVVHGKTVEEVVALVLAE